MATHKKNVIEHRARKNMGSAEFYRKQRKERNLARGPQDVVSTIITVMGENGLDDKVVKIDRVRD